MADKRSITDDASIRDFHSKLRECTMEAVCGRSYVLVTKLTNWLRSEVRWSGSNTTQAGRLLQAVYRHQNQPGRPINVENFSGVDCCLLVFCILLEVGAGELVHTFQRRGIVDRNLPTDLSSLRHKLNDLPNAEKLAMDFDEVQWRFCPARFELHCGHEHPKNMIIPICRKEKINSKGGTAQVWQIDVQEEFLSPRLKKVVSSSRFNFSQSQDEPDYVC